MTQLLAACRSHRGTVAVDGSGGRQLQPELLEPAVGLRLGAVEHDDVVRLEPHDRPADVGHVRAVLPGVVVEVRRVACAVQISVALARAGDHWVVGGAERVLAAAVEDRLEALVNADRRVVLDGEGVVVVREPDEVVAAALLGQPFAVAPECDVVAVAALVVDGLPGQGVAEQPGLVAPAGDRQRAVQPGGHMGERQVRARVGRCGRGRVEQQEVEDRGENLVGRATGASEQLLLAVLGDVAGVPAGEVDGGALAAGVGQEGDGSQGVDQVGGRVGLQVAVVGGLEDGVLLTVLAGDGGAAGGMSCSTAERKAVQNGWSATTCGPQIAGSS